MNANGKVSLASYHRFCKDYWVDQRYPHQRFGQAFCNHFGLTNSFLFYAQSPTEAAEHIGKLYIDYEDSRS